MFKEKEKLSSKEIWKWTNLAISICLVILLLVGIGKNPLDNEIFQFLATSYVLFAFGYWVYVAAWNEWFKSHSLGMNTLITFGTLIPYFYSFYLAIETWTHHNELFSPFFSTAATIMLVISIGENINYYFHKRLNTKISDMNKQKAENANLLVNNEIKVILAKDLKIDDLVIVKKGEIVPADGILLSDYATIDESTFNGEINYTEKQKGDLIFGGVINTSDTFELKITTLYKNSMINQLINKAQRVQGAKLAITKKLDKIATWFTPIILLISIVFFLIQYYVGYALPNCLIISKHYDWYKDRLSISIYYAIGVLVGACPCVFGIAIPIVLVASSGKFLKHSILLNKGKTFDSVKNTNAIAFDKTGTITEGKFRIEHIHGKDEYKEIFYALSKLSNHPLSQSFVKTIEADDKNINYLKINNFKELPGIGLLGEYNKKTYKVVSSSYVQANNIKSEFALCPTDKPLITFSYLLENDVIVLEVQFIDAIKSNAYDSLKELKSMGYKLFLITGDNEFNAKYLKKELGFDKVYAKVLPNEKYNIIKEIQKENDVIFVGDGLNDIEALQQANVSIAMNSGNNISKSVSDFIVLDDDVQSVVDAIKIIKQAIKTIKANLIWALLYNILIIPLAGVGIIMPIISAILMGVSDFVLVSNSMILKALPVKWYTSTHKEHILLNTIKL